MTSSLVTPQPSVPVREAPLFPRKRDSLSKERILELLAAAQPCIPGYALLGLDVLDTVDSTNSWLLRRVERGSGIHRHAVIADCQTQGRGNVGRHWHGAPGGSVLLSLGWEGDIPVAAIPLLPLLAGLAAMDAAQRHADRLLSVKWRNDIWVDGAKLGGVLIERVRRAGRRPDAWVLGVGMNVCLPQSLRRSVPYPVADLREICPFPPPSRNALIADLIKGFHALLAGLGDSSLSLDLAHWRSRDACLGMDAEFEASSGERLRGRVAGIGDDGGLRLWDGRCLQALSLGTLRLLPSRTRAFP